MRDTNVVVMTARLCRDMESKVTSSGMTIGKLTLAFNRHVKKNDEWVDEGNFIDGTLFGKTAEHLGPYLVKGQQVSIEGELKQDRWEKDGTTQSKIGIIISNIQLVGGKHDGKSSTPQPAKPAPKPAVPSHDGFIDDNPDEEIPF